MKRTCWCTLAQLIVCSYALGQQHDYSVCSPIITQGLREYSITEGSSDMKDFAYDDYCVSNSSTSGKGFDSSLEFVVKAVPLKATGNYNEQTAEAKQFCSEYATERQSHTETHSYQETIVSKGYDTFKDCVALVSRGVSVISTVQSYAAMDYYLLSSTVTTIVLKGVKPSPGISCAGQDPSGKYISYTPRTGFSIPKTVSFTCTRQAAKSNASSDGPLYDQGTVQVLTNVGNYDVFLPKVGPPVVHPPPDPFNLRQYIQNGHWVYLLTNQLTDQPNNCIGSMSPETLYRIQFDAANKSWIGIGSGGQDTNCHIPTDSHRTAVYGCQNGAWMCSEEITPAHGTIVVWGAPFKFDDKGNVTLSDDNGNVALSGSNVGVLLVNAPNK